MSTLPSWLSAYTNPNWYPGNRKPTLARIKKVFKCKQCGNDLLRNRKLCFTCIKINTSVRDARKRARLKNVKCEPINKIVVFDRDKWKCRMCKVKTPYKLIGKTDDNSPTLDHIIPLSKGGNHTYSNVQLLCRRCNCSIKRDIFPIMEFPNLRNKNEKHTRVGSKV